MFNFFSCCNNKFRKSVFLDRIPLNFEDLFAMDEFSYCYPTCYSLMNTYECLLVYKVGALTWESNCEKARYLLSILIGHPNLSAKKALTIVEEMDANEGWLLQYVGGLGYVKLFKELCEHFEKQNSTNSKRLIEETLPKIMSRAQRGQHQDIVDYLKNKGIKDSEIDESYYSPYASLREI